MIFFFERSCHVDWRANEYLEQTPTILRKYVLWSAMVKSQELDWMVINPLIGIYIPTVRIPNVGWMTIYCSLYTRFWPRWQLLITVVVLMFFFGVGTCIFHDNIYTSFIGKHQTFKYVCCYVMQLALTHQPRKLRDYCSKAECSGLAHLADCRCSDSCQLDVLLVIQENFMPAIRACENAGASGLCLAAA